MNEPAGHVAFKIWRWPAVVHPVPPAAPRPPGPGLHRHLLLWDV